MTDTTYTGPEAVDAGYLWLVEPQTATVPAARSSAEAEDGDDLADLLALIPAVPPAVPSAEPESPLGEVTVGTAAPEPEGTFDDASWGERQREKTPWMPWNDPSARTSDGALIPPRPSAAPKTDDQDDAAAGERKKTKKNDGEKKPKKAKKTTEEEEKTEADEEETAEEPEDDRPWWLRAAKPIKPTPAPAALGAPDGAAAPAQGAVNPTGWTVPPEQRKPARPTTGWNKPRVMWALKWIAPVIPAWGFNFLPEVGRLILFFNTPGAPVDDQGTAIWCGLLFTGAGVWLGWRTRKSFPLFAWLARIPAPTFALALLLYVNSAGAAALNITP